MEYMQQVVYGICLVYTGGTPIGSLNKNFTSLASNTILKVPVLIWIALVVAVCFWFLYNKTRHGKYMYAIGGNEAAAEVAGVNVYAIFDVRKLRQHGIQFARVTQAVLIEPTTTRR